MSKFKDAAAVLEYAIREEQEAADFYQAMAATASDERMQEVFASFAQEELEHKRKLQNIELKKSADFYHERISDMDQDSYAVEQTAEPDMSYPQALKLVMAKEQAAFRLYAHLAEAAQDPEVRELLLALAEEEAKHKLSFELELDEIR